MNKKIIIDEIDVSGCKYLNKNHPRLDFSECGYVCDKTECSYKRKYLIKQLKQLKKEIKELNKTIDMRDGLIEVLLNKLYKLEKIKEILEYYANSKVGELQPDGTYMTECSGCTGSAVTGCYGVVDVGPIVRTAIHYDPRPAKEALQIIEE